VTANLVTCAIGEETSYSIRGPAAYASCVGISATQELVSRHGMVDAGLNTRCGPICRTVEDAARVLSVIAGHDPEDPLTAFQLGREPSEPYEHFAQATAAAEAPLHGLRIGVVREYMDRRYFSVADHQNIERVEEALDVLASLGAAIVDPGAGSDGLFTPCLRELWPVLMNKAFAAAPGGAASYVVPSDGEYTTDALMRLAAGRPDERPELTLRDLGNFASAGEKRFMLTKYLRERGDAAVRDIGDLISKAQFFEDDTFFRPKAGLEGRLAAAEDVMDSSQRLQMRFATQQVVLQTMSELQLDAFVAPTNNQPAPRLDAPRPLGRHARPDTWSF
jgi:amidase